MHTQCSGNIESVFLHKPLHMHLGIRTDAIRTSPPFWAQTDGPWLPDAHAQCETVHIMNVVSVENLVGAQNTRNIFAKKRGPEKGPQNIGKQMYTNRGMENPLRLSEGPYTLWGPGGIQ